MSRARLLHRACAAALALAACSSAKQPESTPAPEPAATPAPAAAPAAPAAKPAEQPDPTADEVPLTADFDQEAAQTITAENFRAQLDALEKELDADK